jgi:hypothetical protein
MVSTANIDCGPPHSQMMTALVSSRLRAIARETVAIAERGSYRTTPGDDVIIDNKVARAVADTRLYQPADVLPAPTSVSGRSTVEIANESSLAGKRSPMSSPTTFPGFSHEMSPSPSTASTWRVIV